MKGWQCRFSHLFRPLVHSWPLRTVVEVEQYVLTAAGLRREEAVRRCVICTTEAHYQQWARTTHTLKTRRLPSLPTHTCPHTYEWHNFKTELPFFFLPNNLYEFILVKEKNKKKHLHKANRFLHLTLSTVSAKKKATGSNSCCLVAKSFPSTSSLKLHKDCFKSCSNLCISCKEVNSANLTVW